MRSAMLKSAALLLLLQLLLLHASVAQAAKRAKTLPAPSYERRSYWGENARSDLAAAERLYTQIRHHRAKNVVFFLGDGLGIPSITAGRILKGQLTGSAGEEAQLAFERFPHTALLKTYNTDMQTPDSAGTATAYLGGVKARSGTLGVDQHIASRNCSSYSAANNVVSFLEEAHAAGKSVGIVTTTRVTHATPAAAYAHTVWRDWEDDTDRNRDVAGQELRNRCPDIAAQLVEKSVKLSVVFGGGRQKFLPRGEGGSRSDGRNLVREWQQKNSDRRAKYLATRAGLIGLSADSVDTVLGLFSDSHMSFDIDNQGLSEQFQQPTIREMTDKALHILKRNPNGFVLLVEGGRIDHAHHNNMASRAMHDLIAMDAAVESVTKQVHQDETLTIVTADHGHVFSIGGWAIRGNPIFGKVKFSYQGRYNADGDALAEDNLPYTSLNYADGPSAPINRSRADPTHTDTEAVGYMQSAIVNQEIESHGSEDVPIYATGPGAHLFHSTHEQSYVSHLIQYSLCVGEYARSQSCLPAQPAAAAAGAAAGAAKAAVSAASAVLLTVLTLRL